MYLCVLCPHVTGLSEPILENAEPDIAALEDRSSHQQILSNLELIDVALRKDLSRLFVRLAKH